jgi:hypothetical protein
LKFHISGGIAAILTDAYQLVFLGKREVSATSDGAAQHLDIE